jgi:hypothetical protein
MHRCKVHGENLSQAAPATWLASGWQTSHCNKYPAHFVQPGSSADVMRCGFRREMDVSIQTVDANVRDDWQMASVSSISFCGCRLSGVWGSRLGFRMISNIPNLCVMVASAASLTNAWGEVILMQSGSFAWRWIPLLLSRATSHAQSDDICKACYTALSYYMDSLWAKQTYW